MVPAGETKRERKVINKMYRLKINKTANLWQPNAVLFEYFRRTWLFRNPKNINNFAMDSTLFPIYIEHNF